jgi:hypothetical protein
VASDRMARVALSDVPEPNAVRHYSRANIPPTGELRCSLSPALRDEDALSRTRPPHIGPAEHHLPGRCRHLGSLQGWDRPDSLPKEIVIDKGPGGVDPPGPCLWPWIPAGCCL